MGKPQLFALNYTEKKGCIKKYQLAKEVDILCIGFIEDLFIYL